LSDEIKEGEMSGACDMYGRKGKCTQDFGREIPSVHLLIYLKHTSNKYDRMKLTALNKINQSNNQSIK
jgi:hypothetical protein